MWRNRGICGATPNSCGAICGTRRMSNFLGGTPCAALRAGHRTLPPINQRPWPKRRSGIRQERRSAPRGNLRRRPGDGVGGVGAAARSRGASPSLLARGPLGAHTIERPSPPYFRSGTGPADPPGRGPSPSRLAGRDPGPESPTVSVGESGIRHAAGQPAANRAPGRSRFAGGGMDPGRRRLRPEVIRIRTTAGLPEVGRAPDSNESSTPRGDSRRRPDDGGDGRRRS
jgi:hypothetical protein